MKGPAHIPLQAALPARHPSTLRSEESLNLATPDHVVTASPTTSVDSTQRHDHGRRWPRLRRSPIDWFGPRPERGVRAAGDDSAPVSVGALYGSRRCLAGGIDDVRLQGLGHFPVQRPQTTRWAAVADHHRPVIDQLSGQVTGHGVIDVHRHETEEGRRQCEQRPLRLCCVDYPT
jgi:hypothetical protein